MADDAFGSTRQVELEAKRGADGSWHPCQVSLRSGGLSVKLEGQDLEEIILDAEDAFTRLRVRSVPLCHDDCGHIDEGKQVLAACEQNSERLFFDAVVEKAMKVRHSKRACCRCSFIIKWLCQGVESRTSTIPSGSIMKLAAERITSHPVVAAFLNSVKNSSCSTPSPSPTAHDEIEVEIDLHVLEKQIEEIGSLADASENELSRDCAGKGGWAKPVAPVQASEVHVEVTYLNNHVRRSGRKQNKKPSKMEDLVPSVPSSTEKSVENKSPLNPLAARAILASLVSNLPKKIEFVDGEDRKCVSVVDYSAGKDVSSEMMRGMSMSGGSDAHTVYYALSAHAELLNNETAQTMSKEDALLNFHTQSSHGAQVLLGGCKDEALTDSGGSISTSVRHEESNQPSRGSRLTRSAARREGVTSNGEAESRRMAENMMPGRVTCSASNNGTGGLSDAVTKGLLDKPMRVTRSTRASIRESRPLKGEDETSAIDVQAKYNILANSKRVTRSAAHKATGNLDDQVKEALEYEAGIECAQLDSAEETDCLPDASVSTKKRLSPLVNPEHGLVEGNKKQKRLNAVERRQTTAAEHEHSGLDNQSRSQSVTLKNQPLRFSPRLRFLPRTRSQT